MIPGDLELLVVAVGPLAGAVIADRQADELGRIGPQRRDEPSGLAEGTEGEQVFALAVAELRPHFLRRGEPDHVEIGRHHLVAAERAAFEGLGRCQLHRGRQAGVLMRAAGAVERAIPARRTYIGRQKVESTAGPLVKSVRLKEDFRAPVGEETADAAALKIAESVDNCDRTPENRRLVGDIVRAERHGATAEVDRDACSHEGDGCPHCNKRSSRKSNAGQQEKHGEPNPRDKEHRAQRHKGEPSSPHLDLVE